MRKNLIVVRAGDDSLHSQWLNGAGNRNFDLFVSYYGKRNGLFSNDGEYYDHSPGFKWPKLGEYCSTKANLLKRYQTCWFPDDDLGANVTILSKMFDLFEENELWLAQPALGEGSFVNHQITAQIINAKARFTNFVEIMCPIFSREALRRLSHTFSASASGWGLDYLWPSLLHYPINRVAILDETPVVHTREPRTGSLYQTCSQLGILPQQELKMALRIVRPPKHRVFKVVWNENLTPGIEVKQGDERFVGFKIKKSNNKLFVENYIGAESRNESTYRMIALAVEDGKIPDFDWLYVHTGDKDFPKTFNGSEVLRYTTNNDCFDNVCPDFTFDHWRQVHVNDYETIRMQISKAGDGLPETDMLGWRGSVTANGMAKMLVAYSDKVSIDAEAVFWDRKNPDKLESDNYVSLPEQARRWRYLIDVEDVGWSTGLKLLFFSKRVIFLQDRLFKEWYFPNLKPWVHYVPITRDMSDLHEKLAVVKKDVLLENKIRHEAFVFAEGFLTRQAAVARWKEILQCLSVRRLV